MGVKGLIIDDVYTIASHWLSLNDEKLKQIFDNDSFLVGFRYFLLETPDESLALMVNVNGNVDVNLNLCT